MIRLSASMTIIMVFLATTAPAWGHAGHGARIVSYDPGTTPHLDFDSGLPLDIATAALGEPERSTGDGLFPSVVSPFSPPFLRTELVSIGEGGQLTLQLSHFAISQADLDAAGVTLSSTMRIRFTANDDNPQSIVEAGIDAFRIDSFTHSVQQIEALLLTLRLP